MPYADPEKKKLHNKLYREKNREKLIEYGTSWRTKNPSYMKDYMSDPLNAEAKKEYDKTYREENKIDIRKKHKEWEDNNRDSINERVRERRKQDPEFRAKKLAGTKSWFGKNQAHVNEYYRDKYKNDINYRLAKNLRNRLNKILKNNQKLGSAVKDLGCTIEELKIHLESQFKENMNWDNYGEWELDHVMPLAAFDLTNREQFLKACHYTNIQPLWEHENLQKGNKL